MNSLYYQPSGRFTMSGIVLLLFAGLVAAIPLAFAYVYAVWYIPIIYLNLLLTLAFGGLLGYVLQRLVRSGSIRNPALAGLLGLLVGTWAWYVQWCIYLTLLSGSGEVEEFGSTMSFAHTGFDFDTFLSLLLNPLDLLSILPALAKEGTWSIKSTTVSGIPLYLVWLAELLTIIVLCWFLPRTQAKEPYSEMAGQWAEKMTLPRLATHFADPTATATALETADWNHLQLCSAELADTAAHGRLHFYRAPADPECCYLSLENVEFEVDKKGKTTKKTSNVLDYLRVPPQAYQELNARFSAVEALRQQTDSLEG